MNCTDACQTGKQVIRMNNSEHPILGMQQKLIYLGVNHLGI